MTAYEPSTSERLWQVWAYFVHESTGRDLPINSISAGELSYEVSPEEAPILLVNSELVRRITLTYDEEVCHERTN